MKKNWVNEVLDSASQTVKAWPQWMRRPEVRTTDIRETVSENRQPEPQNCEDQIPMEDEQQFVNSAGISIKNIIEMWLDDDPKHYVTFFNCNQLARDFNKILERSGSRFRYIAHTVFKDIVSSLPELCQNWSITINGGDPDQAIVKFSPATLS